MATEIILPRVDMDMATATISRWFASDGESVKKGAVLFEIETDKAAMEIDAPASGRLHRLVGDDTGAIPVGSRLAWILAEGETPPSEEAATAVAVSPEPAASSPACKAVDPACPASDVPSTRGMPRATPLARRLARERGLDLASLAGTGPHGRIQAGDVPQALPAAPAFERLPSAPVTSEAPARAPEIAAPSLSIRPAAPGAVNRVWLRRGEGTPIVMIHGFGGEAGAWRPLVGAMRTTRPILALDLPGHGRSPEGASDFAGIAAAISEALAEEAISEADLVGHSLGAAVATALADTGAVAARSLFLLSPAGLGPDIDGAFLNGFTRARGMASLAPWMRRLVHEAAMMPDGLVTATAKTRQDEAVVTAQQRLAASLFPDATQVFSVREALARISVPVRVVFGLDDRIIPARHASGLPGTVAVHLFPGVGHMPQLEVRDAVLRLLADHLK